MLRLLVVEGGVPAPVSSDVREDWIRAPITDADLRARIATLRAKADALRLPHVDPFGILRFEERSITVSPTETDLLECLIRRFGSLVPRDTLRQCLPERPGGVSRNALDLHIMRLRRRIHPLGLMIRNLRGLGYLLEALDSGRPRPRHLAHLAQPARPAQPARLAQLAEVPPPGQHPDARAGRLAASAARPSPVGGGRRLIEFPTRRPLTG